MLSNMASSLILHKRINTTVAKAKELRKYVEPLITKAKTDSTHSRRTVFSYLQNKESVSILFNEVADRVAERPGGYTRILKTGNRLGDNAEMCIIELVDYNEAMLREAQPAKSKTRRSRRGGKGKKGTETEAASQTPAPAQTQVEDQSGAEVVEEKEEQVAEQETQVEAKPEAVEEEKAEKEEAAETQAEETAQADQEEEKKSDEPEENKDDEKKSE